MNERAQRFPGIDAIKVAGIVTIVLIHALPPPWDPGATPLERWLHQVTRFGVPGFLLASGFLYASGPADLATTRRRLRRILVPYLLASLLAQLWHLAHGSTSPTGSLWKDLLFGSSFGPYYYVFVIAGLVALTPAIARLPRAALLAGTAALLFAQWWIEVGFWPQNFYWHLRNPLLWWAYFAVGWLLRGERARLHAWLAPRRAAVVAALAATVALLTWIGSESTGLPRVAARTASWLDVYAILALVGAAAGFFAGAPRGLRALSDATYAIYLYHLFFLYAAQELLGARGPGSVAVPFAAGLLGSLAVVALGRRLLGARARDWLGA